MNDSTLTWTLRQWWSGARPLLATIAIGAALLAALYLSARVCL